MTINKEELKHIIDDLIINRDVDVKSTNETMYSNWNYSGSIKQHPDERFHQYWRKCASMWYRHNYL